jgi:molybdate transport system ATP-binding protein
MLDTVVHLPLILPPVVTGYLLLLSFGRRGPIGSFLADEFGIVFSFRWTGAALACAIMGFPLMVRAIRLSIEAVDRRLEAAAGTLGANPLWVFATITLPLCLPGIIAGAILGFAKSMGEFGATITFVSNIPGETQTLPSLIYTLTQVPNGDAGGDAADPRSRSRSRSRHCSPQSFLARSHRFAAASPSNERRHRGFRWRTPRCGSFPAPMRAFTAAPGLTALFGRSGSGKTSIVDIVGGLIRPARGKVIVDGQVLVDTERRVFVPAHRRRIGYVFQDSRLFPHLSVRHNLLYGRWFARGNGGAAADLGAVVDLLGIGHLLDRQPGALSGGEKQRVAIGRALLAKPRLLLMDEPLASLDEERKAEILPYIERLRDSFGIPIVYVSHSIAEVARLATHLVILDQGKVSMSGPTAELMSRPDVPIISTSAEAGAILEARVLRHEPEHGLTVLETAAGPLQIARRSVPEGTALRVRILASDVMLSLKPLDGISALNVLPGQVTAIGARHGDGGALEVRLDCNGVGLLARLTVKSAEQLQLKPAGLVYAVIKSVSIDTP